MFRVVEPSVRYLVRLDMSGQPLPRPPGERFGEAWRPYAQLWLFCCCTRRTPPSRTDSPIFSLMIYPFSPSRRCPAPHPPRPLTPVGFDGQDKCSLRSSHPSSTEFHQVSRRGWYLPRSLTLSALLRSHGPRGPSTAWRD